MRLARLTALLAVLALGACAPAVPTVRSEIQVYHRLSPVEYGRTLAVIPADPARRGSLEFQTFADRLAAYLSTYFRIVPADADPELVALFDYRVDDGRQVARTYSVPQYGITGYEIRHRHDDDDDDDDDRRHRRDRLVPIYGVVGHREEVAFSTVYGRELDLQILDALASTKEQPWTLYEARLRSSGGCGELAPVMNEMIGSLFTDFPGTSGVPRRVEVRGRFAC